MASSEEAPPERAAPGAVWSWFMQGCSFDRLHGLGRRLQIAPEARFIDVALGDRGTRDLEIGTPGLVGQFGVEAEHLVCAGLDLPLVDHLVGEHADGRGLSIERLLDLDLL